MSGNLSIKDPLTQRAFHVANELDAWLEKYAADFEDDPDTLPISANIRDSLRASVSVQRSGLVVMVADTVVWATGFDDVKELNFQFCKDSFCQQNIAAGLVSRIELNNPQRTDEEI